MSGPGEAGGWIAVLNCGSSSIKFALFDAGAPGSHDLPRRPAFQGQVDGITGPQPMLREAGAPPAALQLDARQPYHAALDHILQRLQARSCGRPLAAVAHRVVHGGSKYFEPVRVDAAVLADLQSYIPLAPLHQPFALDAIETLLQRWPAVPQVACFDTAFHRTLPAVERALPLPHAFAQRGLRRYGFHGLSYQYQAIALAERHGALAEGRTLVAHLGSGASLCAMQALRSVATTMGFSALDGLMMGTRSGALDPGALLYLMQVERLTVEQVGELLYHRSGLLGMSGLSGDPRVLLQAEAAGGEDGERAAAALALYVHRIVREIGALVAVLGGLDLLVFTAGVGEHNAALRSRICGALQWLGLRLDDTANAAHAPLISQPGSAVAVAVEPTHEEWVAAGLALRCLG